MLKQSLEIREYWLIFIVDRYVRRFHFVFVFLNFIYFRFFFVFSTWENRARERSKTKLPNGRQMLVHCSLTDAVAGEFRLAYIRGLPAIRPGAGRINLPNISSGVAPVVKESFSFEGS